MQAACYATVRSCPKDLEPQSARHYSLHYYDTTAAVSGPGPYPDSALG
jgi:hypothetical protein